MEAKKVTQRIVSRRNPETVLFECEIPDGIESRLARHLYAFEKAVEAKRDLRGAELHGAYLSGALSDANLSPIKTDFFDVLLRAPREIQFLRAALVEGKVDGSWHEGQCACLVGTIARARVEAGTELDNGLRRDSSRPAERFFLSIAEGDTPETNAASKIAVEWIDEFSALLANATGAQP